MSRSVGEQRFARALYRILDLHESTALEVIEDLMPVLPVLDPAAVEMMHSRGELRYTSYLQSPAVAGQFSSVWITNPASSNKLVIVEDLTGYVDSGAARVVTNFSYIASNTVPTAFGVQQDGRNLAQSIGGLYATSTAGAVGTFLTNGFGLDLTVATVPYRGRDQYPLPWVLFPGQVLILQAGTANQDFHVTASWRERVPEQGEMVRA